MIREFIANVGLGKTGTQTVTVRANSPEEAYAKLERMGYKRISAIT